MSCGVLSGGEANLLTQNEQQVLGLIKENPFLSQLEIAGELNLTRSTVATVISSLTAKKQLLGRAYVVNQAASIVCVGGMNIDRKYILEQTLVPGTSNPVTSNFSIGGVARNIAENLGRLGEDVSLLSIGGRDQDFEWLKQETQSFVNFQHVIQLSEYATGTYSAVLDQKGEMQLALADMSVYDAMDLSWINAHQPLLAQAKLIVVDLNVPRETIEYIIDLANKTGIKLVVIPVSAPKMSHLPRQLNGVTWLIVNQDESEAFFDVKVETEADFEQLADLWLATGLDQVIITRGLKASLYANQSGVREKWTPPIVDVVVDVTGAGDSYASGIIYGQLHHYSFAESIRIAMTNAYYTIQTAQTVRLDLSQETLENQTLQLKERGIIL